MKRALFLIAVLLIGCSQHSYVKMRKVVGHPIMSFEENYNEARKILFGGVESTVIQPNISMDYLLYAEEALEIALKRKPKHVGALNTFAITKSLLGKKQEAIQIFQKVVKLAPKNNAYKFNLANSYFDAGKYREAINLYRNLAAARTLDSRIRLNMAKAYEAIGSYNNALENYRIVKEFSPINSLAIIKANKLEAFFEVRSFVTAHKEKFFECFTKSSLQELIINPVISLEIKSDGIGNTRFSVLDKKERLAKNAKSCIVDKFINYDFVSLISSEVNLIYRMRLNNFENHIKIPTNGRSISRS